MLNPTATVCVRNFWFSRSEFHLVKEGFLRVGNCHFQPVGFSCKSYDDSPKGRKFKSYGRKMLNPTITVSSRNVWFSRSEFHQIRVMVFFMQIIVFTQRCEIKILRSENVKSYYNCFQSEFYFSDRRKTVPSLRAPYGRNF